MFDASKSIAFERDETYSVSALSQHVVQQNTWKRLEISCGRVWYNFKWRAGEVDLPVALEALHFTQPEKKIDLAETSHLRR